jgi:inorganic pyrophosphatase/exopolyphosphatase
MLAQATVIMHRKGGRSVACLACWRYRGGSRRLGSILLILPHLSVARDMHGSAWEGGTRLRARPVRNRAQCCAQWGARGAVPCGSGAARTWLGKVRVLGLDACPAPTCGAAAPKTTSAHEPAHRKSRPARQQKSTFCKVGLNGYLSLAMKALDAWLSRSKAAFLAGPTATTRSAVVSLGNEAGDLDSIVSAVAYSEWHDDLIQEGPLFVPAASFERRDFALRRDASLLFQHAGVPFDKQLGAPASLLCLDEIQHASGAWRAQPDPPSLGLALVDHNKCVPIVASTVTDHVVAIVDHHNDERQHLNSVPPGGGGAVCAQAPGGLGAVPPLREIDPGAGSTCSLLVELMGQASLRARPSMMCVLLLGAIAVDTRGFEAELFGLKYSSRDVRAVQGLLHVLGPSPEAPMSVLAPDAADELVRDTAAALRASPLPAAAQVRGAATLRELSAVLLDERHDVSSFTPVQQLRLDYKQSQAGGVAIGIANVFMTLDQLVSDAGGPAALEAAMAETVADRGVDLLLILSAGDKDKGGAKSLAALAAPGDASAHTAAAVLQALERIPEWLPEGLSKQSLFAAQEIGTAGFGVQWTAVPGAAPASGLRASLMRKVATRKTLLPSVLAACEHVAGARASL